MNEWREIGGALCKLKYKTNKKATEQSVISFSYCPIYFEGFVEIWVFIYLQIVCTKRFK